VVWNEATKRWRVVFAIKVIHDHWPPYNKNTSDDVSTSLWNISIQNERLPAVRTSTSFDTPVRTNINPKVEEIQMSAWKHTTNLLILTVMVWYHNHKRRPVLMNLAFRMSRVKQKRNKAHGPRFPSLIPILRMNFVNNGNTLARLVIINSNLLCRSFFCLFFLFCFVWGILFRSFLFSYETTNHLIIRNKYQ